MAPPWIGSIRSSRQNGGVTDRDWLEDYYRGSVFAPLWRKALQTLERDQAGFDLKIADTHSANAIGTLLGATKRPPVRRKPKHGSTIRITIDELDMRLRTEKFSGGLHEFLELLHDRQVLSAAERREVFMGELASRGLSDLLWVDDWIKSMSRPGEVAAEQVARIARQCAGVLSDLHLDPDPPRDHLPLETLAVRHAGDPGALDYRGSLGPAVCRAVALAHNQPVPTAPVDRWQLWRRCGALMDCSMTYDAFISHAGEDKETFVAPLASALRAAGLRIWYDDFTLRLGESVREAIDQGLARSHTGIVVASEHYFAKYWPRSEFNALVGLRARLLPIRHGVDQEYIRKESPMLGDLKSIDSAQPLGELVSQIVAAVHDQAMGPM